MDKTLFFTNSIQVWRNSLVNKVSANNIPYPCIYPDPSKGVRYREKTLRIAVFLLWLMAVGISSIDDDIKNINIISVFLAAACLRINENTSQESNLIWRNAPTLKALDKWSGFINLNIKGLEDQPRERWSEQVLLIKILPDLFSDETKETICRDIAIGEDWLPNVIRQASSIKVRNCLQQYDHNSNKSITCFDYLGINIWSTLTEIEDHIFRNCRQVPSVPTTPEFECNMRNRSRICLLANNHVDCQDIQRLLSRIETFVSNNPVIYKTIAHVFEQYQSVGALPPIQHDRSLPTWWYDLVRRKMCPTFPIHHNLLLIAYIYELMADKRLVYHFQYANVLERFSLAKGAQVNLNTEANQLRITYGPLEINVPCLGAALPDKCWFCMDGNRLTKSQGMVKVFAHLKMTGTQALNATVQGENDEGIGVSDSNQDNNNGEDDNNSVDDTDNSE